MLVVVPANEFEVRGVVFSSGKNGCAMIGCNLCSCDRCDWCFGVRCAWVVDDGRRRMIYGFGSGWKEKSLILILRL